MDIRELSMEELKSYLVSGGEKSFRAAQIYSWLHQKLVTDIDEMTNIPAGLREKLKNDFETEPFEVVKVLTSQLDDTSKYLFRLKD